VGGGRNLSDVCVARRVCCRLRALLPLLLFFFFLLLFIGVLILVLVIVLFRAGLQHRAVLGAVAAGAAAVGGHDAQQVAHAWRARAQPCSRRGVGYRAGCTCTGSVQ